MKHLYLTVLLVATGIQAQTLNWATNFGDVGNDICTDAVVDASGNVYAVGIFKNSVDFNPGSGVFYINELSNEIGDIYCVKLNSNGQLVWAKPIGGSSGYSTMEEITPIITLDAAGNIYISGIYDTNIDMDPGAGTLFLPPIAENSITGNFLCKLSNSGNLLWCKRYGNGSSFAYNRRLKADANGNVYLAGYFSDSILFETSGGGWNTLTTDYSKYNGFLAKFNSDGNNVWAFQLGTNTKNDYIRDMDIDNSGNIVITGSYSAEVNFNPLEDSELILNSVMNGEDIFIAKYDANTTECLWAKGIGREGVAASESGFTIAFGNDGGVISTGFFRTGADFNPAPGEENIYNMDAIGNSSLYLLKLSDDGEFVWAKTIGAMTEEGMEYSEKTYGMDIDAEDNIYLTGQYLVQMDADPDSGVFYLNSNGGSNQVFYMKLNSDCEFEWAQSIGPDTNKNATGRVIRAAPNGKVIIGGRFQGPVDFNPEGTPFIIDQSSPDYDSFLMSINTGETLGIEDSNFDKIAVYPNPFTDIINISSQADILNLELYDITGKLILTQKSKTLISSGLKQGEYLLKAYTASGWQIFKIIKY